MDDNRKLISLSVSEFRQVIREEVTEVLKSTALDVGKFEDYEARVRKTEDIITSYNATAHAPDLTMDDAVKLLGLSKSTIYKMVSNGTLISGKRGKKTIFKEKHLRDWLHANTVQPAKKSPNNI